MNNTTTTTEHGGAVVELPPDYIDPDITGQDRALLEAFYIGAYSEGGTADEVNLRGIRAVLAAAQPAPPAEGEVAELVALINQIALAWEPDACLLGNMTAGQLARAAELLAQAHPTPPAPVPVTERLPQPEDCDADERCWLLAPRWILPPDELTHWLPASALPLPTTETP